MWALIAIIGFGVIMDGLIGVVRPMPALYLRTRGRAALAVLVGLVFFSIGAVQDQSANRRDGASTAAAPEAVPSAPRDENSSSATSAPLVSPLPEREPVHREIEGR